MRSVTAGLIAIVIGALQPAPTGAHEERLIVGRVESIEPARKLLVVADARKGERRRIEVNPETEVILCRTGVGLSALVAGGLVRVKYLDRAGTAPEAQSILLLQGR